MSKQKNQSDPATDGHPGHYLSEWRRFRGWTQGELGAMVSATHSKISRVESGETPLKLNFLEKLAKVFHVPPLAILTINPMGDGRDTAAILDALAELTPSQRRDVLRMVMALARNGDTKGG